MRSLRPFDSGEESTTTQHISSGAIRFSTGVPESVQLCQKLSKSPPIMATNGDAGRGKLATQFSCQEPATGDQRAWPSTPKALSLRENKLLTIFFLYSIGQLGRCIGLQIHREGYQARQDEG
jgi:hypothetical protein